MPRIAETPASLLSDLKTRLARLVDAARAEGRESAILALCALLSGGAAAKRRPDRPPRGRTKKQTAPMHAGRRTKRRNPWKRMTAEQREERVRKMLAGRGLKPKSKR